MDGTMSATLTLRPRFATRAAKDRVAVDGGRLVRLALPLTLALLLLGCGKSEAPPETAQAPGDETANVETAAPVPPSTEPPPSVYAPAAPLNDDAPLWPADKNEAADAPAGRQFIPLEPAPSDTATEEPGAALEGAAPANPLRGNRPSPERPPAAPPSAAPAPLANQAPAVEPIRQPATSPLLPAAPTSDEAVQPNSLSPSAPPKKKEPLFEGWSKPLFALVLSGQQNGYIEPCGCTGLENQKGGLARRHTFIKELRNDRGWQVVPLDVGNQVRRYGKQAEIKFARTAEGLRAMNYGAVTLGSEDLRLPKDSLFVATNPDEKESLFVNSNIALLARDLQPTVKVLEAGGKKIGVTAVLGPKYEEKLQGDDVVHEAPLQALKAAAALLQQQKCDYYVLLSHASLDETKSLATQVPIFDIVVTSGGYGEPTLDLEQIGDTRSLLAQVGTKGMYTGVVGFFADKDKPIRYQRVPLDDRFEDSPEMLQLLADYQTQLKQMGLNELNVVPQKHPTGRTFVGSDTCGNCHTKAFAIWSKTPHAHATDSLVHPPNSRGDISRHHDPECLSCHVTGWEPQKYYPFESGYLSLEETPHLKHNGCENCHGPGSAHVAAENGEGNPSDALIAQRRDEMKLPLSAAERKCMECHDLDNSPDFHLEGAFEKYWKEVEHRGKD